MKNSLTYNRKIIYLKVLKEQLRAAMADQGNTSSYTGRLEDTIKKNERIINDLEEKLKIHDENCQPIIKKLEEERGRLKEENKTLREKIRNLEHYQTKIETGRKEEMGRLEEECGKLKMDIEVKEEANKHLEQEMKYIEETKRDLIKKLEQFELSEDALIIKQLCSSVQENILRIVLQEYFEKIEHKSIRNIEKYITQIEDKDKQDEARERWTKLREEINWDDFLIKQLIPIKASGDEAAHPLLTEEKIENAKMNLKEKKKLGKNMVKAVDKLKIVWQKTNSKLPRSGLGPSTRSAESRDQGGPSRGLFATGQSQGPFASKAAGGLYDITKK